MSIRSRSSRYFAASLVVAATSFVMLPLTTRVLGPHDYGVFALATVLVGAAAWAWSPGAGFLLTARWSAAPLDERTRLVSTLLATGAAATLAWSGLVLAVYLGAADDIEFLGQLPRSGVALAVAGTMLGSPWAVASTTLTLEGRATAAGAVAVGQALVGAATTLICLFVLDTGVVALFAGFFVGGLVPLAFAAHALRPYVRSVFEPRFAREALRAGFVLAQLLESLQSLVERILLSRFAGLATLGLYTHSQRYAQVAHQASKSVSLGVWPVTLAEARDPTGVFSATRRTWYVVHVAVAATGLAVVSFGEDIIGTLTNDRFTEAHVYLAPWFVLLLLQLSAKPEVGTLYALAPPRVVSRLSAGSTALGVALTAILVPYFEAPGAAGALIAQAALYRLLVRRPARRLRRVPFQDAWAFYGIALLVVAFGFKVVLDVGSVGSVVLAAALELALLVPAARVVGDAASIIRPRPD